MRPTILSTITLLPLLLPLTTTHPTHHDISSSSSNSNSNTITPGHAIILNTCAFPIYSWSVSSSVGPQITIPAAAPSTSRNTTYSNYTESYHHDPQTGGVSIKLTTLRNGLYTGAPQTIFAYNFEEGQNQVWFDLSDVFGDPFKGRRVVFVGIDDFDVGGLVVVMVGGRWLWRMSGSEVGDVEREADAGCERCLD
ncbi:hypothetical protein ASPBRDRAFT_114230 [Aspergillus brasiliensis CBS 101740]|uniref:ML-like domain-containing protein n=1 Tax=Aspergillus brasiliensis (strain CBS 101740 / IMI 381727 / IBT 21946) TaxID=767769 RepID=A0A1L9V1H3_ASPBC|nr:hypothetical protein ASPBRDRAFT_114230 [Aspergillus brasiliensis CBS 101740]